MAEKVIKTKTKYINVDARFSNDFPCFPFTDYLIKLQEPIHKVTSLSIACIEIPITFHNICDNFENNNIRVINLNIPNKPSENIIKLPSDHYTIKTIVEQINNELEEHNINDLKFTFSKNNITIKSLKNDYLIDFTPTKNSYSSLSITDKDTKPNPKQEDSHLHKNNPETNNNCKSKLGKVLGFNNQTYYVKPNTEIKQDSICYFLNPRYLFLELRERHKTKECKNYYAFTSSFLDCRISKYIIARITTEYHAFPFTSILPANLLNGFLISDIRHYKKNIRLEDLEIRLLNEFGYPICLNGFEISLCIVVECQDEDDGAN